MYLDFEIDKITNCVEDRLTGEKLNTEVQHICKDDMKKVLKKEGWAFNWKGELKRNPEYLYKLVINGSTEIQGLLSISIEEGYVFMNLIENAPINRGKLRKYQGVCGNLVAFACKVAFDEGFEGNIAFIAKTQLIEHYEESLGAVHIGRQRMIIRTSDAIKLVRKYFNGYSFNKKKRI